MRPPPRLATFLIRILLPDLLEDPILGDLRERWEQRGRKGQHLNRSWYWYQAVTLPYWSLHRRIRSMRPTEKDLSALKGERSSLSSYLFQFRIAARSLTKPTGFTWVAIVTLAMSVGAGSLVFSLYKGLLLDPLPYPQPSRVISVFGTSEAWKLSENEIFRDGWDRHPVSLEMAEAFTDTSSPLAAGGVYLDQTQLLTREASAIEISMTMVGSGVFEALGVRAQLGRLPTSDEFETGENVVVLSHSFWLSDFGGNVGVLDSQIELEEVPHTIIGVMPRGFFFPDESTVLWSLLPTELGTLGRSSTVFSMVARLTDDTPLEVVSSRLRITMAGIAAENPEYREIGARAEPMLNEFRRGVEGRMKLFLSASLLVILLACINLANLVFARTIQRRGEIATRIALGAGVGPVTWSVVAEVLLVGAVGGGLGVLLAFASLDPVVYALDTTSSGLPRSSTIQISSSTLVFALAVTMTSALLASLPAVYTTTRRSAATILRETGRSGPGQRGRRTLGVLLGLETGLAVILLIGSGTLLQNVWKVTKIDLGFRSNELSYLTLTPSRTTYPPGPALDAFLVELTSRLNAFEGVQGASVADYVPASASSGLTEVTRVEDPGPGARIMKTDVGPEFFETVGIQIVAGRLFRVSDNRDGVQVTILSESLAADLFPEGDAIGRRIKMGFEPAVVEAEIVGVVRDVRIIAALVEPQPHAYRPIRQEGSSSVALLVRSENSVSTLRAAVLDIDPTVAVHEVGTITQVVSRTVAPLRAQGSLIGLLAILATGLSLVGVYGVVSHVANEQRYEIGIRMALGSEQGRESWRLVRKTLTSGTIGILVGMGLSIPITQAVGDALVERGLLDQLAYPAISLALLLTAILAAWIPGRKAARVDPAIILRDE